MIFIRLALLSLWYQKFNISFEGYILMRPQYFSGRAAKTDMFVVKTTSENITSLKIHIATM